MLKLSSVFILLFITLGPLKTIAPFVQLTTAYSTATRRMAALRASTAALLLVVLLFSLGRSILVQWGVSLPAVSLTGGIILFLLSLQVMRPAAESPDQPLPAAEAPRGAMLISRLVIPTIITPPGIVSVLALSVLSEGNRPLAIQILGLLALIMLINLLIMLTARSLLAFFTPAGLRVIGWVFAVLQATLGTQVILNALRRLQVLPSL